MYYHDAQFQRQRHRERIAEMRDDYRRAQPPTRDEWQPRERMRSTWQRIRRRSTRRAPAYRA